MYTVVTEISSQVRCSYKYSSLRPQIGMIRRRIPYTTYCTKTSSDPVVISGVSCRLPSCDSFSEFGRKLREGEDFVAQQNRFLSNRVPPRLGLLPDLSKFDASFFRMPPKMAEASDPQLRMLLEVVFETIVDAGVNPQSLSGGKVGVFVAASGGETQDYSSLTCVESESDGYKLLGSTGFMLANQISYCFNFKGTSLLMSSGCSSSMVALEMAISSLRDGRVDAAVVAASSIYLNPIHSIEFVSMGALSPDGICRSFDNSANGFVRSEAIIAVLLQRKNDARRCRATVKSVATNHDGYKPEGLPYPSSRSQLQLLSGIYGSQIDPKNVTYVEGHGTGTPVGDPEELEAISETFCSKSSDQPRIFPLLIGSVKSNLGHTENASGLCGIAKVLTIFQSGVIPPNLYYSTPNDKCPALVQGLLKVVSKATAFEGGLVGVSSVSIGGVNGHVVLEPCLQPAHTHKPSSSYPMIMLLSGRSKTEMHLKLQSNISHVEVPEFRELVHSAFTGTIPGHNCRGFGVLLSQGQDERSRTKIHVAECSNVRRPLWYVFGGLGSDLQAIEDGLIHSVIPFASSLQSSSRILTQVGMELNQLLNSNGAPTAVDIEMGFVALTAIQIAFVSTLKAIGIQPDGMIGYSAGELACGYTDGCLTQEEALLLSYYQGKSYNDVQAVGDAMASVGISWEEATNLCPPGVFPACNNAKDNVTVAGKLQAVTTFVEQLKSEGISGRVIQSYGISPHRGQENNAVYGPMRSYFEKILGGSSKSRAARWISSSVPESEWSTERARSSAQYYVNNLQSPVLFYEAMRHVPEDAIVVEIGLSALLKPLLKRSLDPTRLLSVTNKAGDDHGASFLGCVGELFTLGVDMDVSGMFSRVPMPAPSTTADIGHLVTWNHDHSWSTYVITYPKDLSPTVTVDLNDPKWSFLRGHTVGDAILFPAAGYLYLAWNIFADKHGVDLNSFPVQFSSVNFRRMTFVDASQPNTFRFNLLHESEHFEIHEGGELVVQGKLAKLAQFPTDAFGQPDELNSARKPSILTSSEFYKEATLRGFNFSGDFRSIQKIDAHGQWADVEWKQNWITFLDGIFQAELAHITERSSLVPVNLPHLTIDPVRFLHHIHSDNSQGTPIVQVLMDSTVSSTYAPGIIASFTVKQPSQLRAEPQVPVLLKESFTPFFDTETTSSVHAWYKILDVVIENINGSSMTVLTVSEDAHDSRWTQVAKFFEDHSEIKVELRRLKPVDLSASYERYSADRCESKPRHWDFVVTDNIQAFDLKHQLSATFVLVVKTLNEDEAEGGIPDFVTIAMKTSQNEQLTLLKKKLDVKAPVKAVEVCDGHFGWLTSIQNYISEPQPHSDIYLWTRDPESECGIVGLVRCLRKELCAEYIHCIVFPQGAEKPNFEEPNPELIELLIKGLAINVLRGNHWGTYAHVPILSEPSIRGVRNISLGTPQKDGPSGARWLQMPANNCDEEQTCSVSYASINFRDILMANGTLLDLRNPWNLLGIEYSGHDSLGRRVMGLVRFGALSTSVVSQRNVLWDIPETWTLEDAATVPSAYCTAFCGLIQHGRLQPGQSVLIHSGAGGTGQAAIQVALGLGCEVFTTVGTEEKKSRLLEIFPQLSRDRIGQSRDASFTNMVLRHTRGRGVDVAMNSLTGRLVESTLRCVAKGGRFVDICAAHMLKDTVRLDMRPFFYNIEYHGVFLAQMDEHGEEFKRMTEMLRDGIRAGTVVPLERSVFRQEEAVEALRLMQKGSHTGKLLLNMSRSSEDFESIKVEPKVFMDPQKLYIVVGGLGGIGFELVSWLVDRGARNVAIVSRTGNINGYHTYNLRRLKESKNASVTIIKTDIRDQSNCENLLRNAESTYGVGGIFNCSLVLRDGPITQMTEEQFRKAYSPKAIITRNLDIISRNVCKNLEYFVVFTSTCGAFGSEFQSNYGYANVEADRICETRANEGHPALALQLGVVADTGYVADKLFPGRTIASDFNQCYEPQRIASVLVTLEKLLLLRIPACSSFIPRLKCSKKAKKEDDLLSRVLKIIGVAEQSGDLDLASKLKDYGLDSLSSTIIRQVLQREYKTITQAGKIGDMRLLDLVSIEQDHNI